MAASKKSKPAARSASKKSVAKKTTAKKSAATKPAAKKKVAVKKAAAKKSAAKKTATKKTATKKTAVKKTAVKKATAKTKTAPKKTPAKKTAVKKAAAKKPVVKKTVAKKKPVAKESASSKPTNDQSTSTTKPKQAVPPKPTPKPKQPSSPRSVLLSNDVPEKVEIPKPRGTSKDGITYTKDFDVKFLKAQREELLARRASELARATRLEDEATSLIEDGEMGDVQFDDEGGEGDTMVVQRDLDRLLSGQARQTVADIDEALARIEAGTYGYSSVSGKPIPRERLEAIPETTVLAVEKVSGAGLR